MCRCSALARLVVHKVDRVTRSLSDLLPILRRTEIAGTGFRSLTEPIDTSNAAGRLMLQLLGAFAEFERSMIRERSMAAQAAARERGARIGRPRSMTQRIEATLVEMSIEALACRRLRGVAESTCRRRSELFCERALRCSIYDHLCSHRRAMLVTANSLGECRAARLHTLFGVLMSVSTNPAATGVPSSVVTGVVKIRTLGRDVLASGTVLVHDSQDVEMSIGPVRFVFAFVTDPALSTVIQHKVEGDTLTLSLTNFRGQGAGTSQPFEVGFWEGRRMYVSLSVNTFPPPNPTRILYYTFALGDPV